jgi:hypothetical protein
MNRPEQVCLIKALTSDLRLRHPWHEGLIALFNDANLIKRKDKRVSVINYVRRYEDV